MDFEFEPADREFRQRIREFLREHLPADLASKVLRGQRLTREEFMRWHRVLHARGWSAPPWPREFGGPGWSPLQQLIFDEECCHAGAPPILPFGVYLLAPVLMAFGSPAQRRRFLPRILSGEDWWCQGYSEPGAGSDLAALRTRAERRGDHYIVNGQKTWNSFGHYADWMFCLVRTANTEKPQAGISFLLIDMRTPGISVRPIELIDGSREVNEVWLEDVVVPVENLVGQENAGWSCAKALLQRERVGIAQLGSTKRELLTLKRLAARTNDAGRPLLAEPRFRDRLAQIEIELLALEVTLLRTLTGQADAGPLASVLKIRGAEIMQQIAEARLDCIGPHALVSVPLPEADDASWDELADWSAIAGRYFSVRKLSIFGGTNEIQRNLIAHQLLKA